MVERILVATDGSDHAKKAILFACDFALKYKATVYLVHVLSQLPPLPKPDALQIVADSQEKFARKVIEDAEKEVKGKGVEDFQSTILQGNPAREILAFAKKKNIDTIFMGSRGAGSIEGLLLGSVSSQVCHLAESPCVTVK